MNSKQFIKVDWSRLSSRYDGAFGTKAVDGHVQPPTVTGAWNMFVDFVTANFQRESFPVRVRVSGLTRGCRTSKLPCWYGAGIPAWIGYEYRTVN